MNRLDIHIYTEDEAHAQMERGKLKSIATQEGWRTGRMLGGLEDYSHSRVMAIIENPVLVGMLVTESSKGPLPAGCP